MQDLPLTPTECRGARAMLRWKQEDLAARARVSRPVVVDFERETRTPQAKNLEDFRRVMEEAGIEWCEGGWIRLRPEEEDTDG